MFQTLIIDVGLPAIFLLMVAESACIPIPSEVTMLLGGAVAGGAVAGAQLDLAAVIAAGTAGNVVGSYLAWAAGRSGGRAAVQRWGHYVWLEPADLDRAHAWFDRYGPASVLFGRLLPVVRTFISLPAGIAGMPAVRFGCYTLIGCLPWSAALAWAGYAIGGNWRSVEEWMRGPTYLVAAGVAIALAVAVAFVVRRHRRESAAPSAPSGSTAGARTE